MTSIHQPKEYWNGNLEVANEDNPIVLLFMQYNISGIFLFTFLWLTLILSISYFLPPKLLRILSLFVLVAHTLGGASWLGVYYGFWYMIIFVILNSILFIVMEDIYVSRNILIEKTHQTEKKNNGI